ncbi:glycosyltransferase, partial [Acidobacteria bacterium AH-259-D05]|nr:glycosyltransferase [Acidobacteria bacterium AH-259-D05]
MKKESDLIEELKNQRELIQTLQQRVQANQRQRLETEGLLNQVLQSRSWQLTSPLRWLTRQYRRIVALPNTPRPTQASAGPVLRSGKSVGPVLGNTRPQTGETAESVNLTGELKPHQGGDRSAQDRAAMAGLQAFLASDSALTLPTSIEPDLSVILVLFNRAELTLACLRSLCENHHHSFEVIIVDNASTDPTRLLLNRTRGAHIIHNTTNVNFLLGVNQAAKEARGRYLLVLNNDTQVLPGSIASALHTIDNSDDIGAVGGKIILMDGTLQEAGS